MTAKPPTLDATATLIAVAIADRDDAIRKARLRRRDARVTANAALYAAIRAAIEQYAEGATAKARKALYTAANDRDAAMKDLVHVDQQNQALSDELNELRPKLANAETVRDELRRERDELGAKLDQAIVNVTAGREQIADLQGQLAISADHLCEPLPQRTRQANASIREGLDAAGAPMPAAPATPAKTKNGTGSRPGRSHRAATTKTRTSGGVDNPKPGESFTEPPA